MLIATDLLTNYVSSGGSLEGVTVARIFVEQYPRVATGAQTENGTVRSGLYIDSRNSVVADLNDPVTDPYSDWMMNRSDGFNTTTATAPNWLDPTNSSRYQVRSKRKVEQIGRTLWLMTQISNSTGGTNLTVSFHTRVLLLLP